MQDNTWRMYGFVPYQLSGIQSGIQFGHAAMRYAWGYKNTEEYQKWIEDCETFIILNGGTTNMSETSPGGMNIILKNLLDNDINCAWFKEPDLGNQLTGIAFLVNEKVYDLEKWPDLADWVPKDIFTPKEIQDIRHDRYDWPSDKKQFLLDWTAMIEPKNVFLRKYLKKFRLAN